MKVVVIGATGHVGGYLVPRLVESGHQVIAVSRGQSTPYRPHAAWQAVRQLFLDRNRLESEGTFAGQIAALEPQAVIDLICFDLDSARHLVQELAGRIRHYLFCGTIWVHGPSAVVPTTEDRPRAPFGEYGIRKAAIEEFLLEQACRHGFPATVLHPGHIVGEGWVPLNPQGNFNPQVFTALARGEELPLPNLGQETVHHVHADDVAQGFVRALQSWSTAVGQSFHLVSPGAVSLRGYAERVASWFGRKARLSFQPWEQWRRGRDEKEAGITWDHIAHSPCCSIEKAGRLLGYRPRYSSLEAVYEALQWLLARGIVSA